MKNIISNLNSIINKFEVEQHGKVAQFDAVTGKYVKDGSRQCSTLLNTYITLINQFYDNHTIEDMNNYLETLKEHSNKLDSSGNSIHDLINISLNEANYKTADKWALVIDRMLIVSNKINTLIGFAELPKLKEN